MSDVRAPRIAHAVLPVDVEAGHRPADRLPRRIALTCRRTRWIRRLTATPSTGSRGSCRSVRFDSRSRFQEALVVRLPFVDTHVHYWDLKDPKLRYAWLERDWVHPILGDIDGLKVLKYMADQFIAETRFQNVSKAVHVQVAIGIGD